MDGQRLFGVCSLQSLAPWLPLLAEPHGSDDIVGVTGVLFWADDDTQVLGWFLKPAV